MNNNSVVDVQAMVDKFQNLQPWNHNFTLPYNIETRPGDFKSPAKNKNKLKRLEEIFAAIDLNKKEVLDIGCNEGYFSLEMARRGAKVTGLDVDKIRLEKALFVKSLVAEDKPINYICANFLHDDIQLRQADIVLCLGFLHRVPDPISAIEKLSKMGHTIIFEWKAHSAGAGSSPSAIFTQQPINLKDTYGTEYWIISVDALRLILSRYGFNSTYLMSNIKGKREILVASKEKIFGLKEQSERIRLMKSAGYLLKSSIKAALQATNLYR